MKLKPGTEKKDGIILPGATNFARKLGLTRDKFTMKTYLWKTGSVMYISFVETTHPGRGHFRALVEKLLQRGYTVKVPTPLGRMQQIVKENNYSPTTEISPKMGQVEVWVKTPMEALDESTALPRL